MNSTNIKVISEEIQRLKDQVHAIDVEVPDPSQATDGQILSIDGGEYVISDLDTVLPDKTGAATGDVLGLVGEAKTPGWITPYTPVDYSTTEQDTGFKWIDGKSIYRIVFNIPEDSEAVSPVRKLVDLTSLSIDKLISVDGFLNRSSTDVIPLNWFASTSFYSRTSYSYGAKNFELNYAYTSTNYFGGAYVIILYTKADPEPEPTVTRKRTSKKGE